MESLKSVNVEWLDTASQSEINRLIFGHNDGQGDHIFYTFDDLANIISESEEIDEDSEDMGDENLGDEEMDSMPPKPKAEPLVKSQVLRKCFDVDHGFLSGNDTDTAYFDGSKYWKIMWIF